VSVCRLHATLVYCVSVCRLHVTKLYLCECVFDC